MKMTQFGKLFIFVLAGWLTFITNSFADSTTQAMPTTITVTQTTTPIVSSSGGRLWNLQDADIISVINEVAQETGKNFVIDPRVNGKISLISSKPLRKDQVYQVFLAVLGMLGYSAIPGDGAIKIVPNMESGEQATAVANNKFPGHGEEVVVRVIPLENVSSTQLIPILRPLLPQWSNISAYPPGNILILLGRASNLKRIINVIRDVDRASNNGIQVIPLKRASAVQVANVLNNLQNAARASGESPTVSIAVDDRSNSILLGGPKAMRLRMRVLISQLDSPAASPAGNTEVVYLRYLQAKMFAPLLGKIAQNILGKGSNGTTYDATSISTSPNSTTTATTTKETIINESNIQAETSTNALIITAAPALMAALKGVIAKLDIRPAEVLVEAIIAEIEENNITALGIQWGSAVPKGVAINLGNGTTGSFPVALGAGVFGIIPRVRIQAILSLLRSQTGVDILSTPSVMVLDNQKATIEIGQDVPYQNGQYTTPGSTVVQPFATTAYKKVTLKLDVQPQINLGCSVRLKLNLKNDTLKNPENPGTTPIINTSNIKNSVLINTDDILVIGGLISHSNNENYNKVPFFGDIPILGNFFKHKLTSQKKKILVVFIKPTIINSAEDAMLISHVKYSATRSTQANFRDDLDEVGNKRVATVLPPWKNTRDLPTPFETSP